MYVTAVALFVGPLLSKIGVFSYTVGLLFVLLSFLSCLIFNGGDDCLFADSALKGLKNTSFHLSSIFIALFVFGSALQLLPALDKPMIHNISTNSATATLFCKGDSYSIFAQCKHY